MCQACDVSMRIYTRNRPEHFTARDLEELDAAIITLRDTMRRLFGDTGLGTPKLHAHSHLTDDIRRLGHPRHYNSDVFEAAHALLKLLYRWGCW